MKVNIMNESYWQNFSYEDCTNSSKFTGDDKRDLCDIFKNNGKMISDIIFKDHNVSKLVKTMPKQKKHFLLDFETSKSFKSMSMTTISSDNLILFKQLYGESLFKSLIKNKVYITFDNLGFSPLILMALYAQYYQNNLLSCFFRGMK